MLQLQCLCHTNAASAKQAAQVNAGEWTEMSIQSSKAACSADGQFMFAQCHEQDSPRHNRPGAAWCQPLYTYTTLLLAMSHIHGCCTCIRQCVSCSTATFMCAGFGFGVKAASSSAAQASSAAPQSTPGFGNLFAAPASSAAAPGTMQPASCAACASSCMCMSLLCLRHFSPFTYTCLI